MRTETHLWRAVGRFSLVADKFIEMSECGRVTMTLSRQLSNARHNDVCQTTLHVSRTANVSIELHIQHSVIDLADELAYSNII